MKRFKSIKNAVFNITISERVKGNELPLLFIFKSEIKKSNILKEQFKIDKQLSKLEIPDNYKILYINESLNVFKNISSNELFNVNETLYNNLIKKLNKEQKFQFDSLIEDSNFIIDDLIIESCKNRNDLSKKINLIESFINDGVNESINDNVNEGATDYTINKKILDIAVNKFNDKYSFLDENEKNILDAFLYEKKENIQDIFNKLIKENLNLIKRRLSEEEEESSLRDKLNQTLNKLNEMSNLKKIDLNTIIKLNELKSNI